MKITSFTQKCTEIVWRFLLHNAFALYRILYVREIGVLRVRERGGGVMDGG